MKDKALIFILLGVALIISFMIIFDPFSEDNATDTCKDTSETVGEYRVCLALEECEAEFENNSTLKQDCLTNVFYQALQ